MADFTDMLGVPPQQQQQAPGNYAGVQSPEPSQFINSISKPAQSPEEFQERQGMWSELVQKVNTNPQLRQAMLMMGVQMAQPVAPGQTPFGHVAQAIGTGAATYNAGEYQKYQQDVAGRKEQRDIAESGARVEASEASTAATRESTRLLEATHQLKVDQLKNANKASEFELRKATSEEEVAKIERDLKKRRASLALEIPDATVRKALEAELDGMTVKVEEARARAAKERATAEFTRARTSKENKEIESLKDLSPEQLRQYFTKSGPYATTATSGIVQQAELWGRIYDKLPAEDASKKGKTREQYMRDQLTTAKEKSLMETYTKLLQVADYGDPLLGEIRDMLKAQIDARKGQAPAATPEGDEKLKWTSFGAGTHETATRKDGTVVIRKKATTPETNPGGPSP